MSTNVVTASTNMSVTVTNIALTDPPAAAEETAHPLPDPADPAQPKGETNVVEVVRTATTTNAAVKPAFLRHQEVVDARKTVAHNINRFIQNTRSGALGVTGSVLLIFAAISMLSRVEVTFNDIWGVTVAVRGS